MGRHAWRRGFAWGLAAGTALALAVTATFATLYGAVSSPAVGSPTVPPASATAPPKGAPFTVVLNHAEAADRVGPHTPSGVDAVFVVADVTIENRGSTPLAYGPSAFRLAD